MARGHGWKLTGWISQGHESHFQMTMEAHPCRGHVLAHSRRHPGWGTDVVHGQSLIWGVVQLGEDGALGLPKGQLHPGCIKWCCCCWRGLDWFHICCCGRQYCGTDNCGGGLDSGLQTDKYVEWDPVSEWLLQFLGGLGTGSWRVVSDPHNLCTKSETTLLGGLCWRQLHHHWDRGVDLVCEVPYGRSACLQPCLCTSPGKLQ